MSNFVDQDDIGFFNKGAILDEIPVSNRDTHEQIAFRDPNKSGINHVSGGDQAVVVPDQVNKSILFNTEERKPQL